MIPKHKRFVLKVFLALHKYSRKQDSVDLESEVMRGPGSMPTGGNILSLFFFCFHAVKTKMPILAFSCSLRKNSIASFCG